MASPANPAGALFCVEPRITITKISRGHKLKQNGRLNVVSALISGSPAVLAQPVYRKAVSRCADRNHQQHPCRKNRAHKLSHPIADHVLDRHPPRNTNAQADRGVDVAAGDRANAVGCGNQPQPEGERDAQNADLIAGNHGRSTPKKHQNEGAYQFRQIFLHESSLLT